MWVVSKLEAIKHCQERLANPKSNERSRLNKALYEFGMWRYPSYIRELMSEERYTIKNAVKRVTPKLFRSPARSIINNSPNLLNQKKIQSSRTHWSETTAQDRTNAQYQDEGLLKP